MQSGRKFTLPILAIAVLLASTLPARAQQIRFPNFASLNNLALNGSSAGGTWQGQHTLRLTTGPQGLNTSQPEVGTTYFSLQQPVADGFTTYFAFQMHNPTTFAGSGDGLAFIIQNSSSTDSSMGASGAGLTALGANKDAAGFSGLGYTGIKNSLAIEFDINQNAWDPNGNHVAVQSCGQASNTPVHIAGQFTIYHDTNVTSCLVGTGISTTVPTLPGNCHVTPCTNGAVHQVVVEYTPPAQNQANGMLKVWVDPMFILHTHTPTANSIPQINIPYTIDSANALALNNGTACSVAHPNCLAWVGFTASQDTLDTTQDVLAWEFTPHTPTVIQQLLTTDGSNNVFTFGAHDTIVKFPADVNTSNTYMTVLATPVDRGTFYNNRLKNSPFPNEVCIVYLETGGNCMLYTVTCQGPDRVTQIPCPSTNGIELIAVATSYYTADPVTPTNADYLKADPIGTNNWITICNPPTDPIPCYQPNVFDGTTSGKGNNFSDFVATFMKGTNQGTLHALTPAKPVAKEPEPRQ
jgi:hypothetical protein